MIHGVVSKNREATISLVVVDESRQTKLITAVIGTGYTSFLSLPSALLPS
jgi:predicted aspartyl protease